MTFVRNHQALVTLLGAVLMLTFLPVFNLHSVLGNEWRGIMPTFTDELNFARVQTIGEGHLTDGNAYYLEHADGAPLVIFGGAWLNAVPLWAGVPFNTALMLNFIFWSLFFAAALYLLLRELRTAPWVAAAGSLLVYIEQFSHVWRPVNMQPVFPFLFLFYVAVLRLLREQTKRWIIWTGALFGAAFYLFAYFWQIAAITLGLIVAYALVRRDWKLAKAATVSGMLGVGIGLPVPLYMLWLSHASPYFWESMGRLGLVSSHLPSAEIFYSGGWIGVVIVLILCLWWRAPALRRDVEFRLLAVFFIVTGLGLWVMQGSNLITGKWLETGEHVRRFIFPWLLIATTCLAAHLFMCRTALPQTARLFSILGLGILFAANAYALHLHFWTSSFIQTADYADLMRTEQLYAAPFAWLDEHEKEPVVVWSDPHDYLASVLPIFTRHFTLHTYFGMLELASDEEIQERYLVSQYFNNPTLADLRTDREMNQYLGRHDYPHAAKTKEREVKVCRLVFFWDTNRDCWAIPTSQDLLGEQFFVDLHKKFKDDIRPNIKSYLAKYHVAYVLKDKVLNPKYRPETLGAELVYADERFELYHL